MLLAVGFGGGLAPVLLVLALDRTPAGTVSLFLNLELVATAVIARVFLQEHIGRRTGAGIVVVVLGGVVLAGTAEAGIAVGAVLVAATCVCWGIDNAISASLDSYTPSQITLAKGLVAGSFNLAIGLILYGTPDARYVVAALGIGALGYGLSITMSITGARLVGAARGQAIFALTPFIGALLAWPVNGDHLTVTTMIAFTLSLAGVIIVATSSHAHAHRHELLEHSHPMDPTDPHHNPDAIDVVAGTQHRHLVLTHEHQHLPDIHHRHTTESRSEVRAVSPLQGLAQTEWAVGSAFLMSGHNGVVVSQVAIRRRSGTITNHPTVATTLPSASPARTSPG